MAAIKVPQTLEYKGGQLNATHVLEDFQDSPDDEEDTRSNHEYLNDLEEEYQERALLAKSKRFFKKGTQSNIKGKLALLGSNASAPSSSSSKNKGLIAKSYDWDKEKVSSDDNDVTEVKALMKLTDEERVYVGKESANNGEWVKISIQK
nr:retrovirus-related Pol polyprotein from transposon TNT 1-94 [Tanacetum cinerariifolium]